MHPSGNGPTLGNPREVASINWNYKRAISSFDKSAHGTDDRRCRSAGDLLECRPSLPRLAVWIYLFVSQTSRERGTNRRFGR